MRKILFNRESKCIQPIRELIEKQNHRIIVMWALDCAEHILPLFQEKFPDDNRPAEAIKAAGKWAKGEIKMPEARKAILAAHQAASDAEEFYAAQAAARAVAQGASAVHVETHALGVVFYGLTAFVYNEGMENYDSVIKRELQIFYNKLLYWEKETDRTNSQWADFLLKNDVQNKEKLLRKKEK